MYKGSRTAALARQYLTESLLLDFALQGLEYSRPYGE